MESHPLELLAAVSVALAALAAVFSAWTSSTSAKAARESVQEAKAARRLALAPKLTLEKQFVGLHFIWPHADSLNGEPAFLSNEDWKARNLKPPTFILQNFGQSPALELTIVFELDDDGDGELLVPEAYGTLGLAVSEEEISEGRDDRVKVLEYRNADGSGAGLPMYRVSTIDLPNCAPGQKRSLELPTALLNRLFLRGLQRGGTMRRELPDITLTAKISCHAIDLVQYETQFRWRLNPYHHGSRNPIVIYGHVNELPMYPRPSGPRVA